MHVHAHYSIPVAGRMLDLGATPVLMGIVNVTPDSFSDGGDNFDFDTAIISAKSMISEGADIIDVGGESTRPGSEPVPVQQEMDRVIPVLQVLRDLHTDTLISIDTRHAIVADKAIQAGAHIINDVSGLQSEPEMAEIAATHDVPVIAMHWDTERNMGADIIDEMKRFFERTISIAEKAGVKHGKLILDPGFGFAKSFEENYVILRRLSELTELGFPLLSGTSRKSMIGKLLDVPPKERLAGTIATSVLAYQAGAHIFRVHDVRPNRDALRVAEATIYAPSIVKAD